MCVAVEAGLPAGQQLMTTLAQDNAGVLSLGSPGVSRSTRACGEWTAGPSGPPFAEAGEEGVRYIGVSSGRVLLLIETQLYVTVLTSRFQFRTHKCHTGSEMRPLPMAGSRLLPVWR